MYHGTSEGTSTGTKGLEPMNSVGDILRTERENQGRSIAQIADELCITHGYVRAMENGDFKSLPGLFFYKSFSRQYAGILGIEDKRILPQIAEVIEGIVSKHKTAVIRTLDDVFALDSEVRKKAQELCRSAA